MNWKIIDRQPELLPYASRIDGRMERLSRALSRLLTAGETLGDFANGHLHFGLHNIDNCWVYREWAPAAEALHLVGDFNGWNRDSHPLSPVGDGVWELRLPGEALPLWSRYKVCVTANGERQDRIPLYARFVRKDWGYGDYAAVVLPPQDGFFWHDGDFHRENNLPPLIYEAHIGMATEEERIGSYREFAENVLPRIREDGYNTVQLMAVMEHPYYGSFGYHVSNFFAASSHYGTPTDLKYLIDTAHSLGLSVLLDLVHSHSVKNTAEGINRFDGTDTQFFLPGAAGEHPAWGSKVFDYGRDGVLHFLLSDLKFWLEEYHFDGFRFDGVGSMLYRDHGLGVSFSGLDGYFGDNTNDDAVTYLQLASLLVHGVKPGAVMIAEDVSAMPGLCLPVEEGGIGFDYRLSMGLPDYFIRQLKERTYGSWDMAGLCWELLARRNGEKRIAYAESHDQALVGDQTLMFRMAGKAMYTDMDRATRSVPVENAVALHKLIRLAAAAIGGEGYLSFMGNEFGHPEWIDFPREGNGWSYHYARRQWSLADNGFLRYQLLGNFDKAMLRLLREERVLAAGDAVCVRFDEKDQLLAFTRGDCLFAFNFHPTNSQTGLFLPAEAAYVPVLSTDDSAFGGWDNVRMDYVYQPNHRHPEYGQGFPVYLPAFTALVLKKQPLS